MELEEELKVVGNSLKSLEVSEEKANQRVEEFKKQLKSLTVKLKEAEARAEYAEKTVKKLQKEVDRLEGNFSTVLVLWLSALYLCFPLKHTYNLGSQTIFFMILMCDFNFLYSSGSDKIKI